MQLIVALPTFFSCHSTPQFLKTCSSILKDKHKTRKKKEEEKGRKATAKETK